MINTKLLDNYIKNSGLEVSKVADSLSLSVDEFQNKKNIIRDFTITEIFILCDILHNITDPVELFFSED